MYMYVEHRLWYRIYLFLGATEDAFTVLLSEKMWMTLLIYNVVVHVIRKKKICTLDRYYLYLKKQDIYW